MSISKGSLKRVNSAAGAAAIPPVLKNGFQSLYQTLPLTALIGDAASSPSQALSDAIVKWGLLEPLVVRALPDGTFEVLSGLKRLAACRRLGIEEVPCCILGRLSDGDASEIRGLLHSAHALNPLHQAKFTAVSSIKSALPDHLL